MNFSESKQYLLSLGFELSVRKFGLNNTVELLCALGSPQEDYLKVQVAGTNGKGSTCSFLESILLSAGCTVGLNTSPHLISITERVRIGGTDISEERFAAAATLVRAKSEELVATGVLKALPTYFEQVTAIAATVFSESGVDISLFETGLGGRFDATTATGAELAVLTPISLDHTKTLGPTVGKIATEKAEIIRRGSTVVVGDQIPEAAAVITDKCEKLGIKPRFSSEIETKMSDAGIEFRSENNRYSVDRLGLPGRHQIENARTALAVAEELAGFGVRVPSEKASFGLESARHKGRLEYLDGILFDGAHNASGARALRDYMDEYVERPITMIFGAMGGKDMRSISGTLFTRAERLIFARPANPRSMETSEFAKFVPEGLDRESVFFAATVEEAVEIARRDVGDGLICVTGSLYLVGEVQAYLQRREVANRSHS